jgi:aryl-alcohol dehydrogenase-like predicted oxidoreductase
MSSVFDKRRLGYTDLQVSPIGLGVMQFAGGSGMFGMMFPETSQEDKNLIISSAIEGGINWFDTAEIYGRGNSERGLRDALFHAGIKDEDVIIGTKWFPMFRTARNIPRTIEDRLRYLSGFTIDLYMVHQPWGFSSPESEMDAMADLVADGKIRSVGVSNFNVDQMRRAQTALEKRGLPLAVNQVQYSLVHRNIESNGVLDAAKSMNVTIVTWSPLGSGILSGRFHKNPETLDRTPVGRRFRLRRQIDRTAPLIEAQQEIAEEYEVTPAQVALNWLLNAHGDAVVAIPGASKVTQAEQNAGAMNFKLTDEEMARLDVLSKEILQ